MTRPSKQEEQLVNLHQRVAKKMIKKQLILANMLNLFTFLCFFFGMAFYQWILVEIQLVNVYDSKVHRYWVNLLYMKQDVSGSSYSNFQTIQKNLCQKNIYCSAMIEDFRFSGALCFCILFLAAMLQIVDFVKMIYYIVTLGTIVETKGSFRHIILIATYMVSLSLSVFSVGMTQNVSFQLGVSFWMCVVTLVLFVIVLIYGEFSLRQMVKQALIQNLLDLQKNVRNQKMKEPYLNDYESSSEISVQNQLTL